jgi:bifunctional non-homologous end joining protein LigD
MPLPRWIEPQLCKLATKAPSGAQWAHEIKLDGYRMAARIEDGRVKLLTRLGLDWTARVGGTPGREPLHGPNVMEANSTA